MVGVALGPHEQADGVGAQGEDVGLLVAGRRNTDRHDHDVTGTTVAGAHEVTDLGGVQGDRQIGQHRRTAQLAGGSVDARGDIERHDGGGRGVHLFDRLGRRAFGHAGESGAKDGVERDVGVADRLDAVDDLDAEPLGDLEVQPGVALIGAAPGDGVHGDVDAGVEQLAGDHEAVAAVVAFARIDHHALGVEGQHDLAGHRDAGALHEVTAGDAEPLDRGRVGGAHLLGRE